ncbi:L-threonylcarbamoyladenylate synthase [Patulibacter minatonensis]|uniref:L-threonylcarbamoyladenylate synthase n=1 Tax=Patulibacter minatonensis TaxID=298163 RepID=UPI000686BA06|nr:Sua5/YciO/YrdC/YwlC family protein [Patulibacter minatonensis]
MSTEQLPLDPAAITALTAETTRGGVVLFPAEGVYGLAADPNDPDAVRALATLKGRDPRKPSAVLHWTLDAALAAVDGAGEDVLHAMRCLLPGPVGVLVPNPARRYALALGDDPTTLGLRVPLLAAAVDAPAVVQTSANRAGGPDPAQIEDVPDDIRDACALVLDRGRRSGRPSTIVDLRGLATGDGWSVVREGAVPRAEIGRLLDGTGAPR